MLFFLEEFKKKKKNLKGGKSQVSWNIFHFNERKKLAPILKQNVEISKVPVPTAVKQTWSKQKQ